MPETQHFTTEQIVSDSFRTVANQLTYKIEHFTQNDKAVWKLDSISSIWQTFDKTFSQENGQTILNMIYPLSDGLVWNGNSFNTKSEKFFRVADLGKPFQIELMYFPNTVRIIRQDDSTLLSRNTYIEVYALHVGLIQREIISLQYCNDPDCLGRGVINYGWKELRIIKNYGK